MLESRRGHIVCMCSASGMDARASEVNSAYKYISATFLSIYLWKKEWYYSV